MASRERELDKEACIVYWDDLTGTADWDDVAGAEKGGTGVWRAVLGLIGVLRPFYARTCPLQSQIAGSVGYTCASE